MVGCAYTLRLRNAMSKALRHAPFRSVLARVPEHELCVLHILRGGLNFGLREALHDAMAFTRHGSAFLSSQRRRDRSGTWSVHEDLYRKLDIPNDGVLVLGDVVATGVTLDHALDRVRQHLLETQRSLRRVVLFTVGCRRAEEVLAEHDERFRKAFPSWRGAAVVYLEGRFTLVAEDSELRIALPGTDLIRRGALLAPEFEASQTESLAYALERCVIYDAGSRAFDVPAYLGEVSEYWAALAALAREGWTLWDALAERGAAGHPLLDDADAPALQALCEERLGMFRTLAQGSIEPGGLRRDAERA